MLLIGKSSTSPVMTTAETFEDTKEVFRSCNETVPGQNQIFFSLKLRVFGGSNFRKLEHILTVPLSSSQRSSTV